MCSVFIELSLQAVCNCHITGAKVVKNTMYTKKKGRNNLVSPNAGTRQTSAHNLSYRTGPDIPYPSYRMTAHRKRPKSLTAARSQKKLFFSYYCLYNSCTDFLFIRQPVFFLPFQAHSEFTCRRQCLSHEIIVISIKCNTVFSKIIRILLTP